MSTDVLPRQEAVIFVVDDDSAVRDSLKFSLQVEGYRVVACASGAELLALPALTDEGCVVIDYHLRDMNGLDLLAVLRARHVALPAILVTSHPQPAVRRRAAAAGVPIIEKPLLGNALTDSIQRAIASRQPVG